jgi:hypothetical protein
MGDPRSRVMSPQRGRAATAGRKQEAAGAVGEEMDVTIEVGEVTGHCR